MDELDGDKNANLEGARATVDHWSEDDGAVVIQVAGEIDMSNAATVQEAIDQVAEPGAEHLVFDLGQLEFIDSSGLAVLLAVARRVPRVQLRNPSPMLQRVLEVTGLSETLPTEP